MPPHEQSTQTDQTPFIFRQLFDLKLNDILKFVSSLLLPLALGVFTIVITFQQQNAAQQQRDEDRKASQLQREQDRYLNEQRHKNETFSVYIKEMGQLLKEYNGSLTSNEVIAMLSRVNTLNIFRQLDGQRNIRIIRVLYEAKQLSENNEYTPLDLSTSKLVDIDFRDLAIDEKRLKQLSLNGIFLLNVTFVGIQMTLINFARSHFDKANFSLGQLYETNFSLTSFTNANFTSTILVNTTFGDSQFNNVNFSCSKLDTVNFSYAEFHHVNFISSNIFNVNFSFRSLHQMDFSSSVLFNVDFRFTSMFDINFSFALLNNINFSFASLTNVNFSNARLVNVSFLHAKLQNVNFSSAELSYSNFKSTQLKNSDFSFSILTLSNFRGTITSHTNFQQTTCAGACFHSATLSNVSFWYSNLKHVSFSGASLENINFNQANLYKANFIDTGITQKEIENALSIENVQLSDGNYSYDINLINGNDIDCNMSFSNGWILETGYVNVMTSETNKSYCRFSLQSFTKGATILRRVRLTDRWNSNYWPFSQVLLSANMSVGVSIQLRGVHINGQVLARQTLNSTQKSRSMVLQENMQTIEIFIEFSSLNNQNQSVNYWFENIKLSIIYGSYLEFLRVIPNIPTNARWNQNGTTIEADNAYDGKFNELIFPSTIFVDDDQTMIIVDRVNNAVFQRTINDSDWKLVVGDTPNQLNDPTDVLIDKGTDSLLICDSQNRRVVRWCRHSDMTKIEVFIDDINCYGLAMDYKRYLYVSDNEKHEVRRYHMEDKSEIVVAGGYGQGTALNQLNEPRYLFVDQQQAIYVSDWDNHRVLKWNKGADEGIVVAGGQGKGNGLTQFSSPNALFVDNLGTVYVADGENDRLMRWFQGATHGTIILGGNGVGRDANQFNGPIGLSLDRFGNIYVADNNNDRVQRFSCIFN